ncbi:MAG TPA: hypothetical protein VD969_17360 [Symbiobacteriaceae bacterium]|nr:hypothetical protein [Symbiobacteriaceae bacterium]
MVRRVLVALLLVVTVFAAAPVRAEVGIADQILIESQDLRAGPAANADRPLVLQYPPESLHFYSEGASWYEPRKAFKNGMNQVLEAFFQFMATLVTLVIKTVDIAWNLNLAKWFGSIIDAVVGRYTNLVWSFAGVLFTITAAWVLVQVAKGQLSRIMGHVAVLVLVLVLVIGTRGGVSKSIALVEDAGTEVAAKLLAGGTATDTAQQTTVTSMTDAVYKQLILEPWARANFSTVEVASEKYAVNGIPGGKYLGLTEDAAQSAFKDDDGDKNPDLSPWYDDGALGRRLGVVLDSFLALFLFMPILFLLAAVVLGFKAFTVFFAMGIPVALFMAAMPWSRGLGFLRSYAVWTCISAIVKVACSFVLALYIAFLNGMIDSAHTIPGGWLTVTLIMGAMAFTTYLVFVWPFRRNRAVVTGLRARSPMPRAAQRMANDGTHTRRRQVRDMNVRWAETKTGRRLQVLRPGQQPVRASKTPSKPKASGGRYQPRSSESGGHFASQTGSRRRWMLEQYLHSRYRYGKNPGKSFMPDYPAIDLMREAKRVVRALAKAAENLGGRR